MQRRKNHSSQRRSPQARVASVDTKRRMFSKQASDYFATNLENDGLDEDGYAEVDIYEDNTPVDPLTETIPSEEIFSLEDEMNHRAFVRELMKQARKLDSLSKEFADSGKDHFAMRIDRVKALIKQAAKRRMR